MTLTNQEIGEAVHEAVHELRHSRRIIRSAQSRCNLFMAGMPIVAVVLYLIVPDTQLRRDIVIICSSMVIAAYTIGKTLR